MTIHIEDLTFDVIIGLLDFERDKAQRVVVDIKASYDYEENNFIDYADVVILIQNELSEGHYTLVEEALLGVKHVIYAAYPQINTLYIKISKPHIITACNVALSNEWTFS